MIEWEEPDYCSQCWENRHGNCVSNAADRFHYIPGADCPCERYGHVLGWGQNCDVPARKDAPLYRYARRVAIRRKVYRDVEGFLVMDVTPGTGGWGGDRIFTHTRTSAERIRDNIRRGLDTTLEDFAL